MSDSTSFHPSQHVLATLVLLGKSGNPLEAARQVIPEGAHVEWTTTDATVAAVAGNELVGFVEAGGAEGTCTITGQLTLADGTVSDDTGAVTVTAEIDEFGSVSLKFGVPEAK